MNRRFKGSMNPWIALWTSWITLWIASGFKWPWITSGIAYRTAWYQANQGIRISHHFQPTLESHTELPLNRQFKEKVASAIQELLNCLVNRWFKGSRIPWIPWLALESPTELPVVLDRYRNYIYIYIYDLQVLPQPWNRLLNQWHLDCLLNCLARKSYWFTYWIAGCWLPKYSTA